VIAGLDALEPVTLAALDADVALRERVDAKHVVGLDTLATLLERLRTTHAALEIDGRRAFAYDTIYFDTPCLQTVRAHVQRRRARFKCRTRLYADSGVCAFELKTKDNRGGTVKRRIPLDPVAHGRLTPAARAFLSEHLADVPDLEPILQLTYTRITLAGPGERVTADLGLRYDGGARLRPGLAVVETKSPRGGGVADRVLRDLGSRPVPLSKYVMGAGLTRLAAPPNDLRRLARRCFAHA
jgi:hypothetical protein